MRDCYAIVVFVGSFVFACGGQGEYRKTSGTYAPRGPACDYRVVRGGAVEAYEELGVIDIDAFSMGQLPDSEERFRKVVGPIVCTAGGNGVIPALDIYGHWVHGTVIRFNPAQCATCGEPNAEGGEG